METRRSWILAALVLGCTACGEGSRIRAIEETRVVANGEEPSWRATSAARFGWQQPGELKTGAPVSSGGLSFETPNGWSELPPTAMRSASFRVAGDERAECYLTLLSGDGGGLAANVDRWLAQMSAPPASAAELAALPRAELLGREAVLVDFRGTWKGMNGGERREDQRLIGLLAIDSAGSAFLKMIGPEGVVSAEIDAFHALARSFRIASTAGP